MGNDLDILVGTVRTKPVKQEDGGITFQVAREPHGKLVMCRSLTETEIERWPGVGERVALHGREGAPMFVQVDGATVPGGPPSFAFVKLRLLS